VRGIVFTLTLVALAVPATATAQQVVPPGNSGVDQYKESIPGVGGNRPAGPDGEGASGGSGGSGSTSGTGARGKATISPRTAQSLEKLGPDGQAAGALAEATDPSRSSGSPSSDSSDTGPGMGWVLLVILALTLAGALGVLLMRRRGGAPPGPA
jgi:hypothetical protein